MNGDRPNASAQPVSPVSLFRGLYDRVAKRLGVDPSYVSRVARGERKSAAVTKALSEEVQAIRDHLNSQDGYFAGLDGATHHDGAAQDGVSHDGAGKQQDGVAKHDHDGVAKPDGSARMDGHALDRRGKKSMTKSKPASAQKP